MTDQEIFDRVATHLLSQGRRSMGANDSCASRGHDGLQCAVGCLIPDELYRYELEGWSPTSGVVGGVLRQALGQVLGWQRQSLLDQLQTVHDVSMLQSWRRGLHGIALSHGLSPLACGPMLASL